MGLLLTTIAGMRSVGKRKSWRKSAKRLKLASRLLRSRYNRVNSRRQKRRSAEPAHRKNNRRRKPSWPLSVLRSKLPVNASDSYSSSWRLSTTTTLLTTKALRTSPLRSPHPLQAKNCHEARHRHRHRPCHKCQDRSQVLQLRQLLVPTLSLGARARIPFTRRWPSLLRTATTHRRLRQATPERCRPIHSIV